ncbi:uncharacterized protein LOC131303118 [Rhododendron vialii]|uniref:uncharacterized protein LOC131303118 n=1 Tax=Rhododendron vialii TaxID=182163 RepID=UPI00265E29A3|nr:uncharacterized protein LOC131303118 [Rhododendron vialii]
MYFNKTFITTILIRSLLTESNESWLATINHTRSIEHVRKNIPRPLLQRRLDKTLKVETQAAVLSGPGLTGSDLGNFISKHSHFLCYSLEKTVRPCVDIIKKALVNDRNNQDLIRVLRRPYWVTAKPVSRLRCNIAFLESCGIVEPQLAILLRTRPWLFFLQEPALRNLVSRVVDMGFPIGSRMLVHALFTVSGMSGETFSRKIELFQTFGLSEDEFSWPTCLSYSMGKRIIPRYKVLQLIKRKRPLEKEPSLLNVLDYSEEEFLEKLEYRFRDDAKELLVAYKGITLDS